MLSLFMPLVALVQMLLAALIRHPQSFQTVDYLLKQAYVTFLKNTCLSQP